MGATLDLEPALHQAELQALDLGGVGLLSGGDGPRPNDRLRPSRNFLARSGKQVCGDLAFAGERSGAG